MATTAWTSIGSRSGPPTSAQYAQLVTTLRAAMSGLTPHSLLTAAVASQPSFFAAHQAAFDQINLMTYDLSGPLVGMGDLVQRANLRWRPSFFPGTGALLPSTDGMVTDFETNGVAPAKLGIGIAFYGDVWAGGVSPPRQTWTVAPTETGDAYYAIMDGL